MDTNNFNNNETFEKRISQAIDCLAWTTRVDRLQTAFICARQGLESTKATVGITSEPSPELQRELLEMSTKLAALTKYCLNACTELLQEYESALPAIRVLLRNKNRAFYTFEHITAIFRWLTSVDSLAAEVVSLLQEVASACGSSNSEAFCSLLKLTKQVIDDSIRLTSVVFDGRGAALTEQHNQKANAINFFASLLNKEASATKEVAKQYRPNRFAWALHEGLHRCFRDYRLQENGYVCLRGDGGRLEANMREPWLIDNNLDMVKIESHIEYFVEHPWSNSGFDLWYELYCLSYELLLAKGCDSAINHCTTVDLTAEINEQLAHRPACDRPSKVVVTITHINQDALHEGSSTLPAELLQQFAATRAYLLAWQQACKQLVIDLAERGNHQFAIAVTQPIENAMGSERLNMNLELEFSGSVSAVPETVKAYYFMESAIAMNSLEHRLKFVIPGEAGIEMNNFAEFSSEYVNHSVQEGQDRTKLALHGASAKVRVVPAQGNNEQ